MKLAATLVTIAAVALAARSASAAPPQGDPLGGDGSAEGILEGELLQIDRATKNMLVLDTGSGEVTVMGLDDAEFYFEGEQPISIARVPARSDVRALYQIKNGRPVAERIDVFPHAVPDIDIGSENVPHFRAGATNVHRAPVVLMTSGQAVGRSAVFPNGDPSTTASLRAASAQGDPSTPAVFHTASAQGERSYSATVQPEPLPLCPPGSTYVGVSSASSPGTVLPGGGSAIGGSQSTSLPGAPLQFAQPVGPCAPLPQGRPTPYMLP